MYHYNSAGTHTHPVTHSAAFGSSPFINCAIILPPTILGPKKAAPHNSQGIYPLRSLVNTNYTSHRTLVAGSAQCRQSVVPSRKSSTVIEHSLYHYFMSSLNGRLYAVPSNYARLVPRYPLNSQVAARPHSAAATRECCKMTCIGLWLNFGVWILLKSRTVPYHTHTTCDSSFTFIGLVSSRAIRYW